MKRSFKNVFMIIVILVTSIATSIDVAPTQALSTMTAVTVGLPGGVVGGQLQGAWGPDSTNLFVVGYGTDAASTQYPITYRKSGSSWSSDYLHGSTLPGGWGTGRLDAVWGVDTGNVYAVGQGGVSTPELPLISHWRCPGGTCAWNSVTPPLPTNPVVWNYGLLNAIWGFDANNIIAVGGGKGTGMSDNNPLVEYWNNNTWTPTRLDLPTGYTQGLLTGVWGSSPTNIYAVGYGVKNGEYTPLLYRYTASSWTNIPLSLPTGWSGQLFGIWGLSDSDIYLVGSGQYGSNPTKPLLYQGSGTSWSAATPALPSSDWTIGYLRGVWGDPGTGDVYAVGYANSTGTAPLLYRKTAYGWAPSTYPNIGGTVARFIDIWGFSATDVYAVGVGNSPSVDTPLVAHAISDGTPPGAVTDLTAATGTIAGSVDLSWTAPDDDGHTPPDPNAGPVSSYVVQYSESDNLTTCTDTDGTPVSSSDLPVPVTPNTTQTMTVTGLTPDTQYWFTVCSKDEQDNPSPFAPSVNAVSTGAGLGAGIYDDSNLTAWTYTGTWTTYSGAGPYNNTLHQTSTKGSYAEVTFNGVQVKLTYLRAPGRGSIDVYIDGTKVNTINANGTMTWQAVWASNTLTAGTHTVRFQNALGGWIDLDAVQIIGVPTPVGAGVYDDSNLTAWNYTGTWPTYSGAGPYNNTLHQTSTAGNYAEVYFTGMQVKLTYLKASGRGSIDVYIDGTKVKTINANGTLTWQATWMSSALSPGNHTIRFQDAVGGWIDLDAIEIFSTATPVGPGTYDDSDGSAWAYTGTWTTYSGAGPYNNTLHQSNTTGSSAQVYFTGTQVKLTYLKASGRGSIDVYIDGTKVDTINANGALTWQAVWMSNTLTAGNHTVRFQNSVGGWIDLDAVQILGSVTTVGPGKYDDLDSAWAYTGNWTTYSGAGPYNNTLHQDSTAGDFAEVSFTGMQFKLTYLKAPGRGSIDVYVDGTKINTINANGTMTWQAVWTSSALSAGNHTARFQNAVGGWIDLDAIEIFSTAQPVGLGTYDDSDGSAWAYTGTWTTYSGAGPYNNTLHQSNTTGSSAQVYFTGTQVQLKYLKASGRGSIDVYIDGTKVDTINANGALTWQAVWTSNTLTAGNHTVRFQNASGGWIDLDAVVIQ